MTNEETFTVFIQLSLRNQKSVTCTLKHSATHPLKCTELLKTRLTLSIAWKGALSAWSVCLNPFSISFLLNVRLHLIWQGFIRAKFLFMQWGNSEIKLRNSFEPLNVSIQTDSKSRYQLLIPPIQWHNPQYVLIQNTDSNPVVKWIYEWIQIKGVQ